MTNKIIDCRDAFLMGRTFALMERANKEMTAEGIFSNDEILDRIGEIFREGVRQKESIASPLF